MWFAGRPATWRGLLGHWLLAKHYLLAAAAAVVVAAGRLDSEPSGRH